MKLQIINYTKSLSKAYLKQNVTRIQIETFKTNMKTLFEKAEKAEKKGEHEEHFKNIVSDFLKDTWYKNLYEININKRKDLVIHNGKSVSDTIGVIIEAKKPANLSEMISVENCNVKALWELIFYYFEEREEHKNIEIKHLIANNVYDWFIFDENDFDKHFYRNTKFQKLYKTKIESSKDNPFFYLEAQKIISELTEEIHCIHFNFKDFEKIAFNNNHTDDEQLIDLYKILSPEHLLKKPFANDSNSLNKDFYNELLHIIGLEEKPEGSKKIITRKKENEINEGSLIENAINYKANRNSMFNTKTLTTIYEGTNPNDFFSIFLELSITWINRILFLKLLESQLIKYHNGNRDYLFLNSEKIKDFQELQELFFEVLAEKPDKRDSYLKEKFRYVPYLNSSLFEWSPLELEHFSIGNLKSRLELPIYSQTVLKDTNGNRLKGNKKTLDYIFEFLSAYNFSSDTSAQIQEDNKTIINASVLGLIFEKINGYKDGSFFTPGFITMYMSRETIRRAVAQKFKDLENKEIDTFDDVKSYCSRYFKKEDIQRFNSHVNLLKICDPAVGSGHFLVSALNEMIAIKSELNILTDSERNPIEYEVTVDNDELIILNKRTNRPFEYVLGDDNKPPKSLQIVQETLFHEKQNIIENCLFGVDINPKSVLICRLRLWIELLKNAYYIVPKNLADLELQTLPNIDINIKTGNSLISRFPLDSSLKNIAKASKWTIFSYQNAVEAYKKSTDKKAKNDIEKLIKEIKSNYITTIQQKNPTLQKFYKLKQEYDYKFPENGFFMHEPEQDYGGSKKKREDEKQRLGQELQEVKEQVENEKTFYETNNAFEWRFEFPEVLNEEGDFVGFDVVIGNPPYGVSFSNTEKEYFKKAYSTIHVRTPEAFNYFFGIASLISNNFCNFIIPSSFLYQIEFEKTREQILSNYSLYKVINLGDNVFPDVAAPTCIVGFSKFTKFKKIWYNDITALNRNEFEKHLKSTGFFIDNEILKSNKSFSFQYKVNRKLLDKCFKFPTLKEIAEDVATGVSSGLDKAYVYKNEEIIQLNFEEKILKKLVIGGEINRYYLEPVSNKKIIYLTNDVDITEYPKIEKEIIKYKDQLIKRREAANGQIFWYSLNWPRRIKLFEKPKILIRQTANRIIAAYDEEKWYCLKSGLIVQLPEKSNVKYLYLLALLNSKLMDFIYHDLVNEDNRIFPEVKPIQLFKLPICKASNKKQLEIIKKVEKILTLKKENPQADTKKLETEIDKMVYKLYELTDEEIAIVEGK